MPAHSSQHAIFLQRLLILTFLSGSIIYSLSLLEYTFFHLTGKSVLPVSHTYSTLTEEQWLSEIRRCQSPLFAATAQVTEQPGIPIRARCGRYWPFYSYQVELPASSWIPGAFVLYEGESEEAKLARESFITQMQGAHGGFALLALFILGMSGRAIWQWVANRNEEAAYRNAFHAFVSSALMVAAFTGLMFFVDPTFGLGW